jgi:hypothetical protein
MTVILKARPSCIPTRAIVSLDELLRVPDDHDLDRVLGARMAERALPRKPRQPRLVGQGLADPRRRAACLHRDRAQVGMDRMRPVGEVRPLVRLDLIRPAIRDAGRLPAYDEPSHDEPLEVPLDRPEGRSDLASDLPLMSSPRIVAEEQGDDPGAYA